MMISKRIDFGRRPRMPANRFVDFFYTDRRIRSGEFLFNRPVEEAPKILHKFVSSAGRCFALVATGLDILSAHCRVGQRSSRFTVSVENAPLIRPSQMIKPLKLFGFEILVNKPEKRFLARQRRRHWQLAIKDI